MLVYLYNILIFSRSLKKHQVHVWQVLQSLLENSLYVKAEKRESHGSPYSVLYLRVGKWRPTWRKSKQSWTGTPQTQKQFQHFLGFANFIVEVDTSTSGVGTPLSQRSVDEWNCNVRKWEPQAVKLALEE